MNHLRAPDERVPCELVDLLVVRAAAMGGQDGDVVPRVGDEKIVEEPLAELARGADHGLHKLAARLDVSADASDVRLKNAQGYFSHKKNLRLPCFAGGSG
jgi:hypothetical protein